MLAPTTLIGVSASRSPPLIAVHSAGTFSGTRLIACTVCTAMLPVKSAVAPNASTGP